MNESELIAHAYARMNGGRAASVYRPLVDSTLQGGSRSISSHGHLAPVVPIGSQLQLTSHTLRVG